jgi:hypothetical protein
LSKGFAHGVHRKDLSPEAVRKIIPSRFDLTQKFIPDSVGQGRVEDVFKGRLIEGGHRQDKSLYTNAEISSPTVSVSSVFITVQIAAAENNEVRTLDIGSAYLNAEWPKGDADKIVHMSIGAEVAAILTELDQ